MRSLLNRCTAHWPFSGISLKNKFTILLLLICSMQAMAGVFAQVVNLAVVNMPLDKVCKEIEKQTGYYFVYAKDMNEKKIEVSVNLKNASLSEALDKVFAGLSISYEIIDKVVVINTRKQNAPKSNNVTDLAIIDITGRIINKQFEGLVNATVITSKTKRVVTSDNNGEFHIKGINSDEELTVSYTGYKTQKVKIDNRTNVIVLMEPAENELDKVVVQAYGTTNRRLTTGNIASVSAEDIKKQATMSPMLAIQGRIAGLEISPTSGNESGPVKVEIRGRNSMNMAFVSDPLYIIDGVPLTILETRGGNSTALSNSPISYGFDQTHMSPVGGQNPLFTLNPADIESIEVLKDADATAIYGSRGANGVILISTRKGRPGKNKLDLTISQGMNYIPANWEMLDTKTYLAMRREAFKNDGIVPSAASGTGYAPDIFVWDTTRNVDWQDYLWGNTGKWTNVQTGLTGGTSQTTFRIGAGYSRTVDIQAVSGSNDRASMSFNLNNRSLNQKLSVSLSAMYTYTTANMISGGTGANLPPNAPPVFDNSGNLNYVGWKGGMSFPFSSLLWPYESKTNFLSANLVVNYTILNGLVARTSVGYNRSDLNQEKYMPISSKDPFSPTKPTGSANWGTNRANNWVAEPQLEYTGAIGSGRLQVLVGGTVQSNRTGSLFITGNGYTSDALLHTVTNAPTITASDFKGKYKYAGIFARVGYVYENKYIINLNARRDGSSRFGDGKQFGNFGSIGVAWIMTEESWFRKLLPAAISFVKLRGSYGLTGSDAVGDYQFLSQWGNLSPTLQSYGGVSPLTPQNQANPDFHWEVNKKLEGAIDISFLNDRINFEVAYYNNRCNNQLVSFPTPVYTGFSSVTANSPADVQNSGWEFLLSGKAISTKNFSWTINMNMGINRNKLIAYPLIEQSPYYTRYKIGRSLNERYVYNFTGIDPLTGQYTYEDYTKDGKLTANDKIPRGTGNDDRYVAINLSPIFSGGMGHNFTYKSFTLSTFFIFTKRNSTSGLASGDPSAVAGIMNNTSKYQYDHRWQYPGQTGALSPKLTTIAPTTTTQFTESNGYWADASYLHLRTIALSWMVPVKWSKKAGMSSLAINANAQNIFYITPYKGLSPVIDGFSSMPPPRTITAGITCSF